MTEVAKMNTEFRSKVTGFNEDEFEEENALERVVNLPVVASTWNAMQSYYANVKKAYPTVTPYLQAAENLTTTAANIAMATSRPVVDKIGPTVNMYANFGLDKLEDKVPIIRKQPDEIYECTKSSATNMLTRQVDRALSTTESYVDYYLPSDDEGSDRSDEDFSSDEETEEDVEEEKPGVQKPGERIRNISDKVRRRSYKRAMNKWRGVHTRSKEALSKLHFTVDLIQYAQSGLASTSSSLITTANEKIHSTSDIINKQVEEKVMSRAARLTEQLNASCTRAFQYVQSSPHLQHLLDQAKKAKETTEDLYKAYANKTAIAELSHSLVESTRPKLKLIEDTLIELLGKISDQPFMAWLISKIVQGRPLESRVKDE
ncbi:perilipin-2-like isoform X3 [Clavelina lepadiformis]|uniref:perilipin-2-like isoform X3 n=1 Tax=Clavelina lepadiformis TaxID=159417 RepID=UPI00404251AD